MTFTRRLQQAIEEKNNPTVMGLDPKPEYVPSFLIEEGMTDGEKIFAFNRHLIDAAKDLIPAVKPQLAYYEALGLDGIKAFHDTIRYAKEKGLIVIVDGKRNDIGSTADQYATAYLTDTGFAAYADALTVNPYLGSDGIKPFLEAAAANGKGLFVLVRTSNPSAIDLLDLELKDGRAFYEAVADLVKAWGEPFVGDDGYSPLGAVIGATWPEQADALRMRLPQTFVLVPGYGAQGGSAEDAARLFDKEGKGAIVNASRSLMLAWQKANADSPDAFAEATHMAIVKMRDDLNQALTMAGKKRV